MIAKNLLCQIPEYGRWDDLIYSTIDTPLEDAAMGLIVKQLNLDIECNTPSLLGKWMPSENASSRETKRVAEVCRRYIGCSHKEYRKLLSELRKRINVLERLMSANRWDEIEFDKIPSKAGLIYKNTFARRDIIAKKYEAFMKSDDTKVNAAALYPYDVVKQAREALTKGRGRYGYNPNAYVSDVDRKAIEKYWENLPDYLEGKPASMLCVVDTSGSMTGGWDCNSTVVPIDVAISLGMYCAERITGPFHNCYVSFSSRPQLIEIKGVDFVDKVRRIYDTNLYQNTDIAATFNMLKAVALQPGVRKEDVPKTIVIISDMQIDSMSSWRSNTAATEMERIRADWEANGLPMPSLVYWNVNATNPVILDAGPNVSFVSGCSPVIFKQVLIGKKGWELMMDVLMGERYKEIRV